MNTREDALEQIFSAVDATDTSQRDYFYGRQIIKDRFNSFNDETVLRLARSFSDKEVGETVTYRTVLLLGSGQRKNLESVVRNIMIFAHAEKSYMSAMNMSVHKPWEVFAPVEKFARTKVCGMHNVLETPAQEQQMLAVLHGHFALVQYFMREHNLYYEKYVTKMMMNGDYLEGYAEVLDVFARHPEEVDRLSAFVSVRGAVDPKLLEAVVFFGNDGLPKSMMAGAL